MWTTLDLAVLGRGSKMGQSNAIHLDVAETSAPVNQSRLLRLPRGCFAKACYFLDTSEVWYWFGGGIFKPNTYKKLMFCNLYAFVCQPEG